MSKHIFSEKIWNNFECRLLQILLGALRVNLWPSVNHFFFLIFIIFCISQEYGLNDILALIFLEIQEYKKMIL